MAIYDNDGTTNRDISKLYNNDGSVSGEIDKVYDNDGTVNHLIYQSWDGYLFQNGDKSAITGGWAMTYNGGYGAFSYSTVLSMVSSNWTYVGGTTNRMVDLTGFTQLRAFANYIRNMATVWAYVTKNRAVRPDYAERKGAYQGVATQGSGWITVDVSGLSGFYYIGVGEYQGEIPSSVAINSVQLI